jgi:hypothetical protein
MFKYIRKINYNPEEGKKTTFVELRGRRSNEFEEELEKLIKFQRDKKNR